MNTYILHLETATKVCSVALSLNGQIKQLKEIQEAGFSHGENLTLLIEEILKSEGIKSNQLFAVSIASGPGSYTGLRIGVSTAKGFCYALSIPLIAVDALVSIQQIAIEKYPSQNIIPMIDARRMEVFAAVYNSKGEIIKPISADVLDENSYAEFEPFVACGDGAEKLIELWKGREIIFATEILSSAKGQAQLAYQQFEQKAFEDVAYFEPFYLKDFVMNVKSKAQ
jgi:tRNA threonylcarbamoyladenosine biosynthesis protein TsaB